MFIVVYDDEDSLCIPMSFDPDCCGALTSNYRDIPVAAFKTHKEAKTAIRISVAFTKLQLAQGLPANDDFLSGLKNIKVVPCKVA